MKLPVPGFIRNYFARQEALQEARNQAFNLLNNNVLPQRRVDESEDSYNFRQQEHTTLNSRLRDLSSRIHPIYANSPVVTGETSSMNGSLDFYVTSVIPILDQYRKNVLGDNIK